MSPSWKVIADVLNFSLMRRENSVVFYLLLEEGHSKLFIYYNKKLTLLGENKPLYNVSIKSGHK